MYIHHKPSTINFVFVLQSDYMMESADYSELAI